MIPRKIGQKTITGNLFRMEVYFMDNNYKGHGCRCFELDSLVACFVALDALLPKQPMSGSKVLSVNRLKSGACVKMRGSVS